MVFLSFPSHFLHFHGIVSLFSCIFPSFFLRLMQFSCIFPYCSSHFLSIASYFLHFHSIFYDFYDIILQYSAAKMTDLGGIDTPPSANCLVVHNPAKRSKCSPYSQTESEIWFHFVNHSPPHPLFSLRSQTATSQLAGFRYYYIAKDRRFTSIYLT